MSSKQNQFPTSHYPFPTILVTITFTPHEKRHIGIMDTIFKTKKTLIYISFIASYQIIVGAYLMTSETVTINARR